MRCPRCNMDVQPGICPNCGAGVEAYGAPNTLVWGILGLVFSCWPIGSILGIIFSAIGLGKANTVMQMQRGAIFGKNKVGRILSKAGLIVSIIMSVIWFFYFVVIVGLLASM